MRCNKIEREQGTGNIELTSLASGRNRDVYDARYFFADDLHPVHNP